MNFYSDNFAFAMSCEEQEPLATMLLLDSIDCMLRTQTAIDPRGDLTIMNNFEAIIFSIKLTL